MKNVILRTINLAVIAALACIGCNDNNIGSANNSGRADDYINRFNGKPDVTYYTIKVDIMPPGSGSVQRNPSEASYRAGESVTVTAEAYRGYRFTGWTGELSGMEHSVPVVMNRDLTLTANFAEFGDVDTIPPTIQLNGHEAMEIVKGVNFTDPGAIATDGRGNNLFPISQIKNANGVTVSEVNTSAVGTFNITYTICKPLIYPNGNTRDTCASTNREIRVIEMETVPTYTLTVNKNPIDGGNVSSNPEKPDYTAGEQVTVTAAANPNYIFTGWSGASTMSETSVTVTMSSDLTLTANFQRLYTLTAIANPVIGGDVSRDPEKAVYTASERVTVRATAAAGYAFAGWSDTSMPADPEASITVNEDKVLTANFVRVYTVTFDANGGSGATPGARTANDGSTITLPGHDGLTRGGYYFGGWSVSGSGGATVYSDGTLYHVTGNVTLYAVWSAVPIPKRTVTFSANRATSGTAPITITADSGSAIALPNQGSLTRSGYYFHSWNTDSSGTGEYYDIGDYYTLTGDVTLYAMWALIQYTVTFDDNGRTVTPASGTTGTGWTLASLPTPTRDCHTFNGWFTAATGGTQVTTGRVYSQNDTVYARWTRNTYTITFNANGGSVTPTSGTTNASGTLTSLPTPTRAGYTFNGWYTAATGGTQVTIGTEFCANTTIYAQWTLITYTVTFIAGGTASPTTGTTGEGWKLASLPTPIRTGYTFDGWYTTTTGGTAVTTSTVFIANTTIYARWATPTVTTFVDSRDNKTYKKVTIGDQTWMAENLNYDVPNNTTDVCYGNNDANCVTYGRLYNWETAKTACPSGWHLPSDAEWGALMQFVNPNCSVTGACAGAGKELKSTSGWNDHNGNSANGTDKHEFSALPGGYGTSGGLFDYAGHLGYWWSATEYTASIAWYRHVDYNYEYVYRYDIVKTYLFSARCLQDVRQFGE